MGDYRYEWLPQLYFSLPYGWVYTLKEKLETIVINAHISTNQSHLYTEFGQPRLGYKKLKKNIDFSPLFFVSFKLAVLLTLFLLLCHYSSSLKHWLKYYSLNKNTNTLIIMKLHLNHLPSITKKIAVSHRVWLLQFLGMKD